LRTEKRLVVFSEALPCEVPQRDMSNRPGCAAVDFHGRMHRGPRTSTSAKRLAKPWSSLVATTAETPRLSQEASLYSSHKRCRLFQASESSDQILDDICVPAPNPRTPHLGAMFVGFVKDRFRCQVNMKLSKHIWHRILSNSLMGRILALLLTIPYSRFRVLVA
jgi:hypothetical protein